MEIVEIVKVGSFVIEICLHVPSYVYARMHVRLYNLDFIARSLRDKPGYYIYMSQRGLGIVNSALMFHFIYLGCYYVTNRIWNTGAKEMYNT